MTYADDIAIIKVTDTYVISDFGGLMIAIIPKPYSVTENTGNYILMCNSVVSGDFAVERQKFVDLCAKYSFDIKCGTDGDINFTKISGLDEEEYELNITDNGISVKAGNEKGAFYAIQTLRQIMLLDTTNKAKAFNLPCCSIKDKPRFNRRAFMLDVVRHFWNKDIIKSYLDMMALHKLNVFHWHLTDDQGWRIEIKKYPLLTEISNIRKGTQLNKKTKICDDTTYGEGLFFSQDDVVEIVTYAKALHIEVLPEIDMPGHLIAAICAYPELSCEQKQIEVSKYWGIFDDIGCVGGDKLMPFIQDILDEIVELFPYKYFHIGGDEAPKKKWEKCPKCQAKIKELGLKNENELQGWFNNQVLDYLKAKDRSLVGWNEILDATELSDETIIQWWVHNAQVSGAKKWLEKGNKIVLSPNKLLYMDYLYSMEDLRDSYSVDLDKLGLDSKYESQVLGIEAPLWAEYVRDVDKLHFNTYPRIQSLAEVNWTAKCNKNFNDFDERLRKLLPILDAHGINYAPREAYRCKGLKGLIRRITAGTHWLCDEQIELKKYSKIKK